MSEFQSQLEIPDDLKSLWTQAMRKARNYYFMNVSPRAIILLIERIARLEATKTDCLESPPMEIARLEKFDQRKRT